MFEKNQVVRVSEDSQFHAGKFGYYQSREGDVVVLSTAAFPAPTVQRAGFKMTYFVVEAKHVESI